MTRPTSLVAVCGVIVIASLDARAWESKCYQHPDETLAPSAYASHAGDSCSPEAGPNTVHHRWIGPLDEHRQIWDLTRDLAGLPESLSNTVRVTVFASSRTLPAGRTALASFAPVAFEQATRTQSRSFEIGELAELPDFSYSFFDWALGNETCPLAGVSADATDCHAFATHMGSVNGNHFLPQGQAFYARDHQLALTRAAECRQMSEQLQHGPPGRFDDYVLACEDEAMAIEAMAQHYLQDAWSMGHMWQRWGSSDLTDAPGATPDEKRARALLVSLSVGLIHGARGLLQAVPGWTTYDVNDAMSAPNDNVRFVSGGRIEHGVGDDYLSEIIPRAGQAPPATYAYQYTQMMSCTSAGMLAVYQATGQAHGPVRTAAPMAHPTVDPLGTECWGQRATNSALLAGAGIQFRLLGRQSFIPMDARFVSWALPTVGTTAGRADIDPLLRNSYRFDMSRAMTMLRLLARTDPDGTEAADGGMGDVLGIHPNGAYAGRTPLASYVDPDLPWPATRDTATPQAAERALAIARMFHRAHAGDWCAAMTVRDLEALRAHVHDRELDAMAERAACDVCSEFAARHLRIGTAAHYDATSEPVCRYLGSNAFVYQPRSGTADANALARTWCGCS